MFGMEEDKMKKKTTDYSFDLEEDLKNPAKMRALKEQMEQSVHELKNMLRQGEDKKTFDDAQTVLHGFLAAQKVMQRVNRKQF